MFDTNHLIEKLKLLPACDVYYVALSGGVDSCVLLHALTRLQNLLNVSIRAVHINHQLQPEANAWSVFCKQFCDDLAIPLDIVNVDISLKSGDSIEAAARDKRYEVFSDLLKPNQILMTAHHQDDQAETVLLQLLRGAGVAGLAAMPSISRLGEGWHARPLLDCSRDSLMLYAQQQKLSWINDPMNDELRFDRNYIRQKIMPVLQQRWPKASATIARSASHCGEVHTWLNEKLVVELPNVCNKQNNTLSIAQLQRYSLFEQYELIRLWLKTQNYAIPSTKHLEQLYQDLILSTYDRTPVMKWGEVEVRRYRDELYVMSPLMKFEPIAALNWNLSQTYELPGKLGKLAIEEKMGIGLRSSLKDQTVHIQFRQGGERIKLPGRKETHSLKNLWQEWSVPPWQRERIPLVFYNNQLIAVVGYAIAAEFVAKSDEIGLDICLVEG